MTRKYGSKRDKTIATKGWAAKEGLSIWEAERVMDVELFIERAGKVGADSPHHLMMVYKMFHHTTYEGWKEAEWMVHRGCQMELPKLNPKADLSAIQLVSPHTSKEELQSLYLEVYKQQRLPRLPPGEPELMEKVVSSFDDCQGQRQRRTLETMAWYWSTSIWPPKNCPLKRERRKSSAKRSLANVRNAHQKALATVVALEEEIEWLSWPPAGNKPGARTHSKSRDCQTHESRGPKRRHHQNQPKSCPASYFEYNPLRRNSEPGREVTATKDLDLAELPELEPRVTFFLRGSVENLEEEEEVPPPQPPVRELHKWVMWKAKTTKIPDWWRELLAVPGVPNCKKLARKVQASFSHPKKSQWGKQNGELVRPPCPIVSP